MENLGKHISYWIESSKGTDYPVLEHDVTADAAVIGGGIAGVTCAYLLKKQGLNVVLIDKNKIAWGTSGNTTAKLTSQHGLIYDRMIKKAGKRYARLYAEANEKAIDFVESTVKEHNIDCNFKRLPSYVFTQEDKYVEKIIKETAAAKSLGLNAEYLTKIPLPLEIKAAVRFGNQAQFHPKIYIEELAKQINSGGCAVYEHTKAINIKRGRVNCVVTDSGRKIFARHVVIATHFPFYDKPGLYFTRLYPERAYITAFKTDTVIEDGMYITAEYPGFSVRKQPCENGELVLLAGEDHRTGCGYYLNNHYIKLKDLAEKLFGAKEILYRWSAQDYSTPDGAPYAGRLSFIMPNVYVAAGFDKWGMTGGTASAIVISSLIEKGKSPYAVVYDPCRMTDSFAAAGKFIAENTKTVYKLISGRLKYLRKTQEIKKGEGRLIWYKGRRAGAYRDNEGNLSIHKSTCTHMGCQLEYNDAENTWDCPCHGSRFDTCGKVVESPARKNLKKLKKE